MASYIKRLVDGYNDIWEKNGDPRVRDWFLMSSPLPTLIICFTYVYLVKVLGPRIMGNRKPLELRRVLIGYNFFQVVFSTWLFYEIGMSGWLTGHYNFRCQPVDYSNHPVTLRMVHACWWYYFSKFTEFMDTIFFVLRKKNQHVSTLHVIHHGCMPMSVWFGVKFTPGGHSTFFGLLNTFVHIIMYFYYMMAAMGPKYQKYIWWKKYLTSLQMVQFIAIMVHAFQLLFVDCNYPRAFVWWIGMHAVMFFFLFSDFYKQAYRHKRAESPPPKKKMINGVKNTPAINGTHETVKNGDVPSKTVSNGVANGNTNGYIAAPKHVSSYYVNGDYLRLRGGKENSEPEKE
ncbi:elongation of very long chain fatty acids protein AAEL008004-like isoform X1 [Ischnura elegans]|uniref:elongation of very long chain fatty acids protein AAEL008004-like isoform X1 n=1 Tax=Ischnura elegans TaxID=197161 RepID=UPI001ED8BDB2|nr:elongation of very long chain fatty acids protein AAEL008004-like isoform X1 [Ischnura elegans]XP_046390271.1 elongation of very long chain fatty acids protein AAEL008004-like isoform X1 [Ischnura elegans]XP_046390279.1 elongation of very long chain fatty acids protein AAEL008004-like isoform X1 [Ischnura elegans]